MRQVNIALDLYSALVCLILFGYLYSSKSHRNRLGLCFMLMCMCNFGIAVSDVTNWVLEGFARPWYPAALWAGSLLYYLCTGPLLLAFTGYLSEYLAPKVSVWRGFLPLAGGLCAVQVLCSVLSLWNGMLFTVTAGNIYQRGSWFWLSQVIPALICMLDLGMMVRYHRCLRLKEMVTLSILLIFINLQSARELRMERQEKELAEQRIDIMLSQIQPHFLYNSLTAIRRLCDHDPQQAKQSIRDFALFLQANMDSLKSKTPIPFDQELVHVESYLALELQRFQNRLRVVYDITCRDFSVPPLSLQPIVENAVRHGVLKREEGGTVTIRARGRPPPL